MRNEIPTQQSEKVVLCLLADPAHLQSFTHPEVEKLLLSFIQSGLASKQAQLLPFLAAFKDLALWERCLSFPHPSDEWELLAPVVLSDLIASGRLDFINTSYQNKPAWFSDEMCSALYNNSLSHDSLPSYLLLDKYFLLDGLLTATAALSLSHGAISIASYLHDGHPDLFLSLPSQGISSKLYPPETIRFLEKIKLLTLSQKPPVISSAVRAL